MTEEMKSTLLRIRMALENLTVQGKNNLSNLYGSIEALDYLLQAQTDTSEVEPED